MFVDGQGRYLVYQQVLDFLRVLLCRVPGVDVTRASLYGLHSLRVLGYNAHRAVNGEDVANVQGALLVGGFGVLAVASMQMQGIRANNSSDTLTEATTLASDRMEKLMALNYVDPDLDLFRVQVLPLTAILTDMDIRLFGLSFNGLGNLSDPLNGGMNQVISW